MLRLVEVHGLPEVGVQTRRHEILALLQRTGAHLAQVAEGGPQPSQRRPPDGAGPRPDGGVASTPL